jgi:PAS domain S-box-containing protein
LKGFSTLRKHAASLQDSENAERYQNILRNIHDGCFEVDLGGNFTFFNDSVCRVLGYSREELMGMNYRQYIDKENSKKIVQAYNQVYKTGEPIEEFGWQVTRKDGAKRYIEGSISLRKDSSGNKAGFLGIMNDITERRKVNELLKKAKKSIVSWRIT